MRQPAGAHALLRPLAPLTPLAQKPRRCRLVARQRGVSESGVRLLACVWPAGELLRLEGGGGSVVGEAAVSWTGRGRGSEGGRTADFLLWRRAAAAGSHGGVERQQRQRRLTASTTTRSQRSSAYIAATM